MPYMFGLPTYTDYRGNLTVAEEGADVPFPIKRIFWLHGTQDFRGRHACKTTKQMMICVSGVASVTTKFDGPDKVYTLDDPKIALVVEPECWREIDMGDSAVVLVLCSTEYDPDDYVRSIR